VITADINIELGDCITRPPVDFAGAVNQIAYKPT